MGLTQTDVAQALGISTNSYSKLERKGKFPWQDKWLTLLRVFHMTFDQFTNTKEDGRKFNRPDRFTLLIDRARQLPRAEQDHLSTIMDALISQAETNPPHPPDRNDTTHRPLSPSS